MSVVILFLLALIALIALDVAYHDAWLDQRVTRLEKFLEGKRFCIADEAEEKEANE